MRNIVKLCTEADSFDFVVTSNPVARFIEDHVPGIAGGVPKGSDFAF